MSEIIVKTPIDIQQCKVDLLNKMKARQKTIRNEFKAMIGFIPSEFSPYLNKNEISAFIKEAEQLANLLAPPHQL